MKIKLFCIIALMLASVAQAAPVGIASGNPEGTNYAMVEDIKQMCSTSSSPITNVTSAGSLDNISRVFSDKSSQYGIIQADAAIYQRGQDERMMKNIVMVFPFFSTEIHLVAKDGSPINSLQDLQGKRVIEGPEGSGTWVTAQVIKALTKLQWTPMYAGIKDGIDQVLRGQADAEFIVAGAPVPAIRDTSGIKLVPLKHPALDNYKLYTKAMLNSSTYPSMKTVLNTYKVDNIMITFAFKNQYQKEIGDLVTCIAGNIEKLQQKGHPKWRDVDPMDITRIDWPAHPAALAAIKRAAR